MANSVWVQLPLCESPLFTFFLKLFWNSVNFFLDSTPSPSYQQKLSMLFTSKCDWRLCYRRLRSGRRVGDSASSEFNLDPRLKPLEQKYLCSSNGGFVAARTWTVTGINHSNLLTRRWNGAASMIHCHFQLGQYSLVLLQRSILLREARSWSQSQQSKGEVRGQLELFSGPSQRTTNFHSCGQPSLVKHWEKSSDRRTDWQQPIIFLL